MCSLDREHSTFAAPDLTVYTPYCTNVSLSLGLLFQRNRIHRGLIAAHPTDR